MQYFNRFGLLKSCFWCRFSEVVFCSKSKPLWMGHVCFWGLKHLYQKKKSAYSGKGKPLPFHIENYFLCCGDMVIGVIWNLKTSQFSSIGSETKSEETSTCIIVVIGLLLWRDIVGRLEASTQSRSWSSFTSIFDGICVSKKYFYKFVPMETLEFELCWLHFILRVLLKIKR